MRSALAVSASSLLIIVALSPEGEFRWWITLLGLACIWLLRAAAEQERRDECRAAGRAKLQAALTQLEADESAQSRAAAAPEEGH